MHSIHSMFAQLSFFFPFFFWATPLRKRVGEFPGFLSLASEGLISRDFLFHRHRKRTPPHVVFNIVYHEKKIIIFSCLISFVLGGSLHTFVFFRMFNGQPSFLAPKIRVSRGGKPSTSIGCYECREGPSCLYNHLASELPQKGAPIDFSFFGGGGFFAILEGVLGNR